MRSQNQSFFDISGMAGAGNQSNLRMKIILVFFMITKTHTIKAIQSIK